jgi:hypothetical protein
MDLKTTRMRLVLGAAALLALLVVPLAMASGSGGPTATASSSVKRQVKKLKKQVAALRKQVTTVDKEPGPAGPSGPPGPSTGPASGDLTGNYPNPSIAPGAVTPAKIGTVPTVHVGTPSAGSCNPSIPNATPSNLRFETEQFDTANMHDLGSSCSDEIRERLTAPRAGVYLVSAGVLWPYAPDGIPVTTGTRYLGINKNGNAVAADEREANAGTGAGSTLQSVTTAVVLNQGDFVTAQVNQTSGADLIIPPNDTRNYFSAVWLGPAS